MVEYYTLVCTVFTDDSSGRRATAIHADPTGDGTLTNRFKFSAEISSPQEFHGMVRTSFDPFNDEILHGRSRVFRIMENVAASGVQLNRILALD